MNTRLQVEHPVTEWVTGVDIVKEQIRIAQGEPLPYTQSDVSLRGWAIECRINAEDPFQYFMPSTGKITHMTLPAGPGVRVDTGVYPGFEISSYYDSLISKLIVWGNTRSEAVTRMQQALDEYKIAGLRTNISFHRRLLESNMFINGQFDTRFVEENFSLENDSGEKNKYPEIAAIIATLATHQQTQQAVHIIQRNDRDTSNWKWTGRWERMHRS
jgi:acetyl/propionyl-CoA carboxylase alpha subunit